MTPVPFNLRRSVAATRVSLAEFYAEAVAQRIREHHARLHAARAHATMATSQPVAEADDVKAHHEGA